MINIDNNENYSPFSPDELVVYNGKNNQLTAGGFKIDSIYSRHNSNLNPLNTYSKQKGGNIISGLKGLAVPAGLLYMQKTMANNYFEYQNKDEVIDEALFDKLLGLASVNNENKTNKKIKSKRHTKRNNKNASKKHTRKHK